MTSSHFQLYPAQGELMKVGQVWIIESLREDDRHTGLAIRHHLDDLFTAHNIKIKVTYHPVMCARELLASLEELEADVKRTQLWPILDIECHGLSDFSGVQLSDGSNVSWDTMKPKLVALNIASRFNLFLIMACCNGGYFGRVARLDEPSAMCGYLGPNANIAGPILLDGLSAFFTTLFTVFDATVALNSLRKAIPDFPYFYSTAEGLFRMVFVEYLREAKGKALRDRARSLSAQHPLRPSINTMVKLLKAQERPTFERFRRAYFALDEFPENEHRFTVSYAELLRDATKPTLKQLARSRGPWSTG